MISRFVSAALEGRRPTVHGDGEQSRDFTFVENAVQANLLGCSAEGVAGQVFNVGTGERCTLNDVLRVLAKIAGKKLDAEYVAPRTGDVRHSLADIERARQLLGYDPKVRFEEGLRQTVAWFQSVRAATPPRQGSESSCH